jgi:hypothetical protein
VIVGAHLAEEFASGTGQSYVVFGKASGAPVDLASLGTEGFLIDGSDSYDGSGFSVSGAGDVNGDGLADVVVGASGADPGGDESAGESYVIFSGSVPPLVANYRARSSNGNPPRTAIGTTGDGSNDSTPDSRFWIDFADGGDPTGAASTETVTLTRSAGAFGGAGADVSWHLGTTRQGWAAADVTVRYLDSELLTDNENRLLLAFSPTGNAPFTQLPSTVNPVTNTITARIVEAGFLKISQDALFADGFESPAR